MLVFKVRRRRSPMASPSLTNSQRRIMKLMSTAIDEVRAGTIRNEGKILDALQHSTNDKVISLVPIEPWLAAQEPLQEELLSELRDAGAAVKIAPIQKATLRYTFDAARPEAAAWAATEAGRLIREITEEQRSQVRGFLERSQQGEMDVRQVARQLRDVVGLTPQQSQWVDNHRNSRISELMTDKGMTFDQAFDASDASTARYQARIQRLRAETIARTETLRAARQGQKESYTQARQQGFMQFTVLEWSTSEDDRVCEICGPLNGEQIPMDGQFPGVDDWTDGAHVNCRCEAIPVDPPVDADLATMTDEEIAGEIEALIDGGSTVIPVSPDSGAARTAAEYPIEQIRALDDEGIAMQREAHRIVQERTGKRSDGYLNPEEHPVEAEMYIRGQEIRNESRDLQARFLNESFTTVTEYGVGDEFRRFTDEGNNTRDKYVVEDEKTLSMNRGLRGGRAATARAKAVDDMIAEHSVAQPTRVYRGALLDDSAVATFTPGSTFNDKGFQSADLERSGAEFYANARAEQGIQGKPVLFEVTITPETKAAYVGVGEVVIGRGASMEVLATREEDGFLVVEVVAKHV